MISSDMLSLILLRLLAELIEPVPLQDHQAGWLGLLDWACAPDILAVKLLRRCMDAVPNRR